MSTRTFTLTVSSSGSATFVPATGYSGGGTVSDGSTLTITRTSGTSFGTKPNGEKPLFWWTADGGLLTPSALGRSASWSVAPPASNERQQVYVAPGSSWSVRANYQSDATSLALGAVDFSTDRVYVWRKRYDDFDTRVDYGIRARIRNVTGTFSVGQTVTGASSGATGVISHMEPATGTPTALYFYRNQGTVGTSPGSPKFSYNETMTTATGSGENNEVAGVLYGFNNKIIRFWLYTPTNSLLTSCEFYGNSQYNRTMENGSAGATAALTHTQRPRTWEREEFIVKQNSAINAADGSFYFGQNGTWYGHDTIVTRNTAYPNAFTRVYQQQVSNGAQVSTYGYFDSVYVDDSWCRVIATDSPTYDTTTTKGVEIQIPVTWSADAVSFVVRKGSFDALAGKHLYVIDADNTPTKVGQFT